MLAWLVLSRGLASAEENNLHCIEDMLLPGYGSIARKAKMTGTVSATVAIGEAGAITDLKVVGPDPYLSMEVEIFLKYNTQFAASCNGKSVLLLFTFVLSGKPVTDPTVRVRFKGPNQFVIESQPEAPIVN
jgi:hypothetical protein